MVKVYSLDGVTPVVHPTSFVHPTAVLIGDVVIGPNCYIAPFASLRGDMGAIYIGAGSNIQDNCMMHSYSGADVRIGEGGHIGHGAILHGCEIGENVLIGMNSVIMDGSAIGDHSFVAAMTFIKAGFEVPPRSLATGVPARIVRQLKDQEIEWKKVGTREYQQLAGRYLATMEEAESLDEPDPDRPRLKFTSHAPLHTLKDRGK